MGEPLSQFSKEDYEALAYKILRNIDRIINAQINVILHHKVFQNLEATWKGVFYLCQQIPLTEAVKLRLLDAKWKEIAQDIGNALEFDQSFLFKKVYTQEFDSPGGEPFGLLLYDYYFDRNEADIQALKVISGISASAFAPAIFGVSATFFEIESFTEFEKLYEIESLLKKEQYFSWKKLKQHPDSKFMGVCFPRVCLRKPYEFQTDKTLSFNEVCTDLEHYLWANSVYCFASVVVRSFYETGWFYNIQGTPKDIIGGGFLENLPTFDYPDSSSSYTRQPIETIFKPSQEKILNDLGFMIVLSCQYTSYLCFYRCHTIHQPDHYDKAIANLNASLILPMQHVLSVSRMAHYLKVMGREKVGSFTTASEYQSFLETWILQYTAQSAGDDEDLIKKYPLQEASIVVKENFSNPGQYFCTLYLKPQGYLEQVEEPFLFSLSLGALSLQTR